MRVLDPLTVSGRRALDAGCGSGFFSRFFCDRGMRTAAVDFADQSLAMTRHMTDGRADLLQADLLKEELSKKTAGRFDLIFSDGLFEHFVAQDQDRILRNFVSVLGENGVIATFVPNRWSPWEIIRPFYMPGIDERPFTLSALRRLHERNGLRAVREGGLNTFPLRLSPDKMAGRLFGMILYVVAQKR